MDDTEIRYFVEAALLAAGRPLTVDQLHGLFDVGVAPDKSEIRKAIDDLNLEFGPRGITVVEVASGFRMQIKSGMVERLHKLWEERPPRYSRALFETLALVAYRQPITRGEIEEIRGVSVSSNIVRSLLEREWIRVVGHRDVPGRPAMFGTTKMFLDYFGLKKLDDLPPLADLSDWETLRVQLNLPDVSADDSDTEAANDGFDGNVTTLPLQHRQSVDGADPDVFEDSIADSGSLDGDESGENGDLDTAFTEIAGKEWPDPLETPDKAAAAEDEGASLDADASISR
jgi:segregation and condensation protein B